MQQIIFDPPGGDDPGFLARVRFVSRLQVLFRSGRQTEEDVDSLVDFLLKYVTEPTDREEATALLWDASRNQLLAMLEALGGSESDDGPLAEESK